MQCQILKYIISALNTRSFLSLNSFKEDLNTSLKFRVKSTQFFMHHSYNFIIML